MSPSQGLTLSAKTSSCRPSRPWKQEGKTILIVHHDLSKVPAYFDQVLLLHRKLIAFGKTEETFTKENLHAAYGHELFIGGGVG